MRLILFVFLSVILSSSTCQSQKEALDKESANVVQTNEAYQFPYDLNSPDESQKLPKKLKEISGLSYSESGSLYAIQDENGIIFKIHGEDITESEFRKDGDYEGIEVVGEHVYVVKSSGTIYKVSNLGTDEQIREDFNDFLDDDHNVEGLCYHKPSNSLLLTCKGEKKEDVEKEKRAIYQFDLTTNKIKKNPFIELSLKDIKEEIKKHAYEQKDEAFLKLIEDKGDKLTFAPSAIAIHPITNDFYITSSKGKLLIVLNSEIKLLHVVKLDESIHEQPEGMSFDKEGNLYISNEGKEKSGMIYKFNYEK